MKKRVFGFLVSAATAAFLSGCGNSPLLHHVEADGRASLSVPGSDGAARSPSGGDCPIALPKAGLCATLEWTRAAGDPDNSPDHSGERAFTLQFREPAAGGGPGAPVDPRHDLGVQLWMPSMGHGSSPVSIRRDGVGFFSVTKVYFIMPGDWEIRIQLKEGGRLFEQAVVSVAI